MIIPSTITKVDAAKKGHTLIDDDELFVMRPHNGQQLIGLVYVVRMSEHFDVSVRQDSLRIGAVYGQRELNFFVYQHVDFNALLLNKRKVIY